MSIWFAPVDLDELNARSARTLVAHLGIRYIEIGDDYLIASMPVDERTRQPYGILHGGASISLAESVGSVGANLCIDPERFYCVGVEINGNHVRQINEGEVTAMGNPLHVGRRTQVWEIRIRDRTDHLVCASRLTLAVIERP